MTLYYSATTGGFYDSDIHKTLPPDAVEISAQTHQTLLNANAQGGHIEANAQGYPQPAFLSQEQTLARAKAAALNSLNYLIRSQRKQAISTQDESELFMSLHRYRTALAIQNGTATPDEQSAFEKEIQARARNESLESFCTHAVKQGAHLMQAIGITEGLKQRLIEAIHQASTQTEVEALEQDFKTRLSAAWAPLTELND